MIFCYPFSISQFLAERICIRENKDSLEMNNLLEGDSVDCKEVWYTGSEAIRKVSLCILAKRKKERGPKYGGRAYGSIL